MAVIASLSFIAELQYSVVREGSRCVQRSSAWNRGIGFCASNLSFDHYWVQRRKPVAICFEAGRRKISNIFYAKAARPNSAAAPCGGRELLMVLMIVILVLYPSIFWSRWHCQATAQRILCRIGQLGTMGLQQVLYADAKIYHQLVYLKPRWNPR